MTTTVEQTASTAETATGRRSVPVVPVVLVGALLAMVGISIPGLEYHDGQRVMQVVAIGVVAGVLLFDRSLRARAGQLVLAMPRTWIAIAVVAVVGVVSSLLAVSPQTGLLEVALLGGSAITLVVVAAAVVDSPQRSTVVVLGGVLLVIAVQQLPLLGLPDLRGNTDALWVDSGFSGGFAHPRFMNQLQAMALPVLGAVAMSRRWWLAWPARVLALVTTWSMVLVEGRGATLAVATVLVAIGVLGRPGARRWALGLAPPFLLGAAAALATRPLIRLQGAVVSDGRIGSSEGRFSFWSDAWDRAVGSPLVGVGPGHLAHVEVVTDHPSSDVLAHPHNAPLQFLAEWGIPAGLAITALLVLAGLVLWLRPVAAPGLDAPLGVERSVAIAGVTGSVGAGLLLSQLSGVLVMPVGLTIMTMMGGVALGLHLGEGGLHSTSRPGTSMNVGLLGLVALVAAVGVLVAEVGPSPALDRRQSIIRYIDVAENLVPVEGQQVTLTPRFWQQGFRGLGSGS